MYSAQVGRYDDLTLKAPNLFQWLPPDPRASLQWFGFALAAGFVVSLWFVKHKLNNSITNYPLLIALALLIGLPFFLPRMHDRYFYVADVLSIVFACAFTTRRNVWPALVALAVNAASLAAYVAYLWEHDASVPKLPLTLAAAFMLVALIGTLWQIRPARHSHEGRNPDITPTSYLDSLMTHAHQVFWIPAFAGMAVVAVVLAAAIGGTVRAANDRIMLAATFERDGHGVRLDRAHATRCVSSDHVRIELSWIGSTLRLAPRTAIYSVFLHVYDAQGKRIAVADGYIDGKLPLNDVEFDLTEARDVKLDAPERSATIHVGVYAIESQVRLHATKPDGTPWDGDEVVIPIGEGRCRTE